MAGLLDRIGLGGLDERFQRFSTDPLGMASLGLLLQPRRRKEGTGGFEYALQGMQAAEANQQNQFYRQRAEEEMKARQQEQERQAKVMQMLSAGATPEDRALMASMSPEEFMNYQDYKLKIQADQQKRIEAARIEEERKRRTGALSQFRIDLSGPERLAFDALPLEEQAKIAAQSAFPSAGDDTANIRDYNLAVKQGYRGTFMQYQQESRAAPSPIYSAVPTAQGLQVFNQRTGRLEMVAPGVLPAAQDPTLAGERAEKTAAGTATGQAQAQAQLDFPQIETAATQTINQVKRLLTHPGFRAAVGAAGPEKIFGNIPLIGEGTQVQDFNLALEQVKGGQFLEAFESLKGGGQITETEGRKATQAISDMSTAQSEEAFIRSANEFINIVRRGRERARKAAGGEAQMTTPAGVNVTPRLNEAGAKTSGEKKYPRGAVREIK